MKKIYAVYKGETNLYDGTLKEIAKYLNKSLRAVYCYKSPSKVKKHKSNALELVFIGVEQ